MFKILPQIFSTKLAAVILFTALISFGAHGEIYKWTNKKGEVIYSERKPVDTTTAVREITPRLRESNTPITAVESTQEPQAATEPTVEERTFEDPEQKKLDEQIRKKNCETANARYVSLQRPRTKEVYADGSRRELGEDERQTKIQEATAAKSKWCS